MYACPASAFRGLVLQGGTYQGGVIAEYGPAYLDLVGYGRVGMFPDKSADRVEKETVRSIADAAADGDKLEAEQVHKVHDAYAELLGDSCSYGEGSAVAGCCAVIYVLDGQPGTKALACPGDGKPAAVCLEAAASATVALGTVLVDELVTELAGRVEAAMVQKAVDDQTTTYACA